jgi:hypothetical protein
LVCKKNDFLQKIQANFIFSLPMGANEFYMGIGGGTGATSGSYVSQRIYTLGAPSFGYKYIIV